MGLMNLLMNVMHVRIHFLSLNQYNQILNFIIIFCMLIELINHLFGLLLMNFCFFVGFLLLCQWINKFAGFIMRVIMFIDYYCLSFIYLILNIIRKYLKFCLILIVMNGLIMFELACMFFISQPNNLLLLGF